jgi:hypothetical protein
MDSVVLSIELGNKSKDIEVYPDGRIFTKVSRQYKNANFHIGDYVQLPERTTWNGYKVVSVLGCTLRVHRLVAEAFIPNPDPEHFTEINHKDENKANNHYTNLEWCDRKYNVNYGTRIDRLSDSNKKKDKPAAQFLISLGKKLKELSHDELLAYKRIEYFNRKYGMNIFESGLYKDIEQLEKFKKERQRDARDVSEPCLKYLKSIGKTNKIELSSNEQRVYNRIYKEEKKYGRDIFTSGEYLMSDEEVQARRYDRISKAKLAFYAKRK